MYFKKTICALLSLSMLAGGGLFTRSDTHALSTRKILERLETSKFSGLDTLGKIIKRTREFMRIESKKDLRFYEGARERADSLAFAFFCYLCICERNNKERVLGERVAFGDIVNKVIGQRDESERKEDIQVLSEAFPENPDEFLKRFGIELDNGICTELLKLIITWDTKPDLGPTVYWHRKRFLDRSQERKPERAVRDKMIQGMREYFDDEYDFSDTSSGDDSDPTDDSDMD